MAKRRFRGLGKLRMPSGREMGREVFPSLIGLGLAGLTTIGIRAFVAPTTPAMAGAYRWAPFIGAGVGMLAGVGAGALSGAGPGAATAGAALVGGALLYGNDMVNAGRAGSFAAIRGELSDSLPAGTAPTEGLRALVPERLRGNGMGVITMDPVSGVRGAFGETVNLKGSVNSGAFGTQSFQG